MNASRSTGQVTGEAENDSISLPQGSALLVGARGGDYLDAEGDRLRAYSRLFNFVEVNTTFYHVPRLSTVRSWRRRTPPGFTFSVKCHRKATHEMRLMPCEETFRTLNQMQRILGLLRSDMLVIQTPPSLHVDEAKVRETEGMLRSSALASAQVFWETRSPLSPEERGETRRAMLRAGFTPVIDLAWEEPVQGAAFTYSRLFGAAKFSDGLLGSVASKLWAGGSEAAVLAFHGSAMYRDASRFNGLIL